MSGYCHDEFESVAAVFSKQIKRTSGGAAVAVYHRGKLVVDLWGGQRIEGEPWQQDTVAMSFSTTKGVVSTGIHLLADRGLIDYDARVTEYWPEFGQNGKQDVTVRNVLTHSCGLHRIRSLVDRAERMLDWDYMTNALAEAAPAYPVGKRSGYHALTYGWLAGEIVRRVSGQSISAFVRDEIATPLNADGMYVGLPSQERERVAPLGPIAIPRTKRGSSLKIVEKTVGKTIGKAISASPVPINTRRLANALAPRGVEDVLIGPDIMDAEIPAANGFFTARSLAKMYAMYSGWGEVDGVRMLSEETIAKVATPQKRGLDLVLFAPMDWRLGFHRIATTRGPLPRAFGHFGFGGSGAWADPSRDLAIAMVCSRGTGTPVGDLRILTLGAAAVKDADARDRRDAQLAS
ncbi:MAG: beta-lactamase family protein [Actinobacteria bacterium]|nr:beta-lactamase family protein [Actinomycetota bacterium]